MSFKEPLAWPFRQEQLEALASRISTWNRSMVAPSAAQVTWNTQTGSPLLLHSHDAHHEEPEPAPQAPVNTEPVAFESATSSDFWTSEASISDDGEPPVEAASISAPDTAGEETSAARFVPSFELDVEDDSELDIQRSGPGEPPSGEGGESA